MEAYAVQARVFKSPRADHRYVDSRDVRMPVAAQLQESMMWCAENDQSVATPPNTNHPEALNSCRTIAFEPAICGWYRRGQRRGILELDNSWLRLSICKSYVDFCRMWSGIPFLPSCGLLPVANSIFRPGACRCHIGRSGAAIKD